MSLPNTHLGPAAIGALLNAPKHLFFAGIGGVSMSSLAHISHLRGHRVSGYDRTRSALTAQLEEIGVPVYTESDTAHLDGVDLLVYTVAIPASLPEYAEALRRGIPVISRADYLGYVMTGYRTRIGVSGTHGKSTTTSMLERIFRVAGLDPTVSCGAPLKDAGGRCDRIGGEEYFIFEACEYMDSFLDFNPTDVIVLNIELDHLDYFRDIRQIETSFGGFMARAGEAGRVFLNLGDDNVMRAAQSFPGRVVTFAVENKHADYSAEEIVFAHGMASFTVFRRGEALCRIHLRVPGAHNICDALAAAAASIENGVPPQKVTEGLAGFEGAARRMDCLGVTPEGATVYDDYAHHPTEIHSTVQAASGMDFDRITLVFQPHTYSRTKELFGDFAAALADPALREVILTDIYPARETDTRGMSSELLAEAVRVRGGRCRAISSLDEIAASLHASCGRGDMILVMGAGDVSALCPRLLK